MEGGTMSSGNVKRQERPQILPETVYTRMSELLGTPITSEADAWHFVKRGISTKRYVILAERLQLAPDAVAPASTLRRRVKMLERRAKSRQAKVRQVKQQRKTTAAQTEEARLTPAETERLMRLTRVVSEATQLFGDEKAALSWLNTPGDFLPSENEVTPMKLAETDSGVRMVESMIQRTAHGFF
jgi:putative toxin-antitoxin system antitoxin component (TIGR02293 family)